MSCLRLRFVPVLAALLASVWAGPGAGEEIFRTGAMRVYGNDHIKSYVLLREIPLRTGDPFDYRLLQRGKERLFGVPGVDYADVRVAYVPADSSVAISVVVTERSTFGGKAWLVRGRETDVSIGAGVVEHNFRGHSERLELFVQGIGGILAGASWENPWLGSGPRVGVGLTAAYERYRYVFDDAGPAFIDARVERARAEGSVFYTFSPRTRATLTFGYEHVESPVDSVTSSPGGDDVASLALALTRDARDSRQFPWSGTYARVSARGIDPGGDNIFAGEIDARAFASAFERAVFGVHARAVYRDGDDIPIYRRDHVGGSATVRGYDFGAQGGVSTMVAGFEYRFAANFTRRRPLEDVLLGVAFHAFADAGAAFELGESWDGDRFIAGYGLGVSLLNRQVKGLRVDYGWTDTGDGRFDIDFGLKF